MGVLDGQGHRTPNTHVGPTTQATHPTTAMEIAGRVAESTEKAANWLPWVVGGAAALALAAVLWKLGEGRQVNVQVVAPRPERRDEGNGQDGRERERPDQWN